MIAPAMTPELILRKEKNLVLGSLFGLFPHCLKVEAHVLLQGRVHESVDCELYVGLFPGIKYHSTIQPQ